MKLLFHFVACLFFLVCGNLSAEEKNPNMRTWTDSKSGDTLLGKITNKNRIGTRMEIKKEDNKYVWIEIARLIKADQDYAHMWVKNADIITVTNKVIRRRGSRTILVRAEAGTNDLVVRTSRSTRGPSVQKVKAGEVLEYEMDVLKDFSVTGYHGDKQVDQETASSKTGLQVR